MGAIIAVLVLAGLMRLAFAKLTKSNTTVRQQAVIYALAGALGAVLAAYGNANGGPPDWFSAINYGLLGVMAAVALALSGNRDTANVERARKAWGA